jgi:hypothetical protein
MSERTPASRGNRRFLPPVALCLAFLAGCSSGPPQDLRGPGPQKGQTFREEFTVAMKNGKIVIHAAGERVEGSFDSTATLVEDNEILEVDGRQVTKQQTTFVTDESSESIVIAGEKDGKTERGSLMGEKVLRERKDGRWKNTLVGKEPTAEQKKELDSLDPLENNDELTPEGKVKPGHTWKVDAARMHKFMGPRFTGLSGDASMTFEKTTTLDGESCALIKVTMNVKGKILDDENNEVTAEISASGPTYRSLKSGHDLKTSLSGTAKLTGTIVADGQKLQTEIHGPITVEGTTTLK